MPMAMLYDMMSPKMIPWVLFFGIVIFLHKNKKRTAARRYASQAPSCATRPYSSTTPREKCQETGNVTHALCQRLWPCAGMVFCLRRIPLGVGLCPARVVLFASGGPISFSSACNFSPKLIASLLSLLPALWTGGSGLFPFSLCGSILPETPCKVRLSRLPNCHFCAAFIVM